MNKDISNHSQATNLTFPFAIIHTSDIHGTVMPYRYADQQPIEAGLAKISTALDLLRQQYSDTIYIDNGDLIQGTPLSYYHARMQPELPNPLIACMNIMKADAAVIGNHEFNYGLPYLQQAIKESHFPWLSANLLRGEEGEPFFGSPYIVKECANGLKIGILGVTTPYIPNWELPQNIAGIYFEDAVTAAKRWVDILRNEELVDLVIVSYHGGFERDLHSGMQAEADTGENQGYRICMDVPGIDILLTGHQHRLIVNEQVNGVWVAQPSSHAQGMGYMEISMTKTEEGWSLASCRSEFMDVDGAASDERILDAIADTERKVQAWLDQPIGRVEGSMAIDDPARTRLADHPLITFINRVQMEYGHTDISNTALFDDSAPGFLGSITMRHVMANYMYPNTLRVIRISGQDIKDALEQSATYFTLSEQGDSIQVSESFLYPKPQHYNYDMWSGIEYEIQVSQPIGERVTKLTVSGAPIELHALYDVAMNNYRAGGGGNYHMFANKPVVRDLPTDMAELIADYIMKRGTITAVQCNSWKVVI
ncbi:bifunctional metallophosphatase/5'-nucleotidase [Paenibacillus alvei]|uniref:bifunctional metallophosphatase/5'-nucleotidase n=2 Tax=Paenibacillus alvei TaxID=44250 RepID=UPI00028946A5|nr:bifunctional UDP-sugar hydrolase/5'-nucleotidase [Paenibacillus alvei]EJW15931.1 trifunctional nucleotide phosphoesterase protein YfkN [Paenibacillus alvei DSM 29]MCY7482767.1 bifunctional metallophosphatase/5'-nucleotidase [Paenibacillus alvei]MCY9704708.1 bifunctional metallophosphatase/5'-nucleotidase [Paenibacillus alvei]MCY9732633.1 bifunctional metallophosphatase/5'-nucleotidase [Paenibacillus alvei]MCY9755047.1 bifunctional metallophosphatase/5'-nucleotidase [Paenibacillus alvei]